MKGGEGKEGWEGGGGGNGSVVGNVEGEGLVVGWGGFVYLRICG